MGMSDLERAAKIVMDVSAKNERQQKEAELKQFNEYIESRKKRLGKLYDFEESKESYLNSIRTSIQNRVNEGDEKAIKKYLKIFEVANSFTNPEETTSETPTPTTPDEPTGDGNNDEKLTPEDHRILNSKKKLAEFLAQFKADQKIQDEIADLEENEAAQLKEELDLEAKFLKMAEDAGYETIEAAGLEDAKQSAIDKVKKKWNDKFLADNKKYKAQEKADDDKFKQEQIRAEEGLQRAKSQMLHTGINILKSFTKEGSEEYKALFAIEKIVAAAEVVISGISERAKIAEMWGWNPAISTPMLIASKIRTGTGLATIAATAIQGFETAGYTGPGESSDVAGVVHKDEYVVPQFIMQDPTYAPIINQLEQKRTDTLGVENSLPASVSNSTDTNNEMVATAFYALIDKLNQPLFAKALIGDAEIERQKTRQDKLVQTRINAKIN